MRKKVGPQFVRYFGPVLDALKTLGGSGRPAEVKDQIAQKLAVSDAERNATMESGESRYGNQIDWARFYLVKGGLLASSTRGVWTLTDKGRSTSLTKEQAVDLFDQIHRVIAANRAEQKDEQSEEQEVEVAQHIEYRDECMARLRGLPPAGFERFCQGLRRESGFETVTVTGKSGDGGIDGIGVLQVGALVSFKVLFQCKRYAGAVGSEPIRNFRGAMSGRADKGIVLTTGTFTSEAKREAVRDGVPPIEMVDGDKLLDMMEDLKFGLKPKDTFDVDDAFFDKYQ